MNGCSNYRLISESSTATNDSLEARNYGVSKDCCFTPQTSGQDNTVTQSVCDSTGGNKTSSNTNYDLSSETSSAPLRQLRQIFEAPRAELEKKKRSKYENDVYANDLHNIGKSKFGNGTVASAISKDRNTNRNCTDTAIQNVEISDMSESPLYLNVHKTVSMTENRFSSIDKSKLSTCNCFHSQNLHLNKNHELEGQDHSDVRKSLELSSIKIEAENKSQTPTVKTENPPENNLNFDGNPLPRNVQYNRCNTKDETLVRTVSDLKVRDEIINDYQLQEMMCHKAIKLKLDEEYAEIQKLRRNYSSLRKLFLALAILNIILILCVVSVMPVLLVISKLSNQNNVQSEGDVTGVSAKHLSSAQAGNIVKEHVFCVKCDRLKDSWSKFFTEEHLKSCCIKDVATFVDKLLVFIEKARDGLLKKIEYDNERQNNDIFALQNAVLNTSFNGSNHGPLLIGQSKRNSELINKVLTRKRFALHFSATGSGNRLEWVQDIPQGHSHVRHSSHHHGNMIKVKNGGVYFVYSCIHFDTGSCRYESYVGYHIKMTHGPGEHPVASNHQSCVNGTDTEMVLTLQQMVNIPSGTDSTLHIEIDSGHLSISENRHHYFGLFEI